MFDAPSLHDLIEEERLRFEAAVDIHLGWRKGSVRKLRDGDGYGDRMYIVGLWWSWLVAVGLLEAVPKDAINEHSIVDSHGQPLPMDP
jgi:hypothetical protein